MTKQNFEPKNGNTSHILTNLRLILVSPQTSGNVGSCARVTANFGITDIHVTDPRCDIWDDQAKMFGKGPARDTLFAMKKTASLAESLADCTHALAFTRRIGDRSPEEIRFHELSGWISDAVGAQHAVPENCGHGMPCPYIDDRQPTTKDQKPEIAQRIRVALIFGREDRCLFSDEMELCTHFCLIPVDPKMPTLNLSHAVAVVLSRLYTDWLAQGLIDTKETYKPIGSKNILSNNGHGMPCPYTNNHKPSTNDPHLTPCTLAEFEGLIGHLRDVMTQADLTQAGNPDRMLLRLRRSLQRASLTQQEISVWRGLLSKIVLGLSKNHQP